MNKASPRQTIISAKGGFFMEKQKKNVKNSCQNNKNALSRVNFYVNMSEDQDRINTDPQGSYTGVPDDPYDKPIQDADDL